jgi:6-phosphogluconolactonase (cycloisomerase 2 family)
MFLSRGLRVLRYLVALVAIVATVTPAFAADLVEVRVTPVAETLTIADTRSFRATAIYSDNTSADVTTLAIWSSLDSGIASVDASGNVTAHAFGDTTLSATYAGTPGTGTVRVRGVDAHLFASSWANSGQVMAFRADLIGGALTANGVQPTQIAPWGVATDPTGRFVYAANRESASVSAFAADATTGVLTPLGTYATGGPWPRVPIVEPRGRFLYVANLGQGGVPSLSGYAIAADGTLTPVPGSPFVVPGATFLATHPSGEFLYVATGADNRIAGYRIAANGALAALPGSPYWFDAFQAFANLGEMAVHRSGRFLFSTSNGTSIRVFGIDPATGVLTGQLSRYGQDHLQLPLVAHPNGRHLFTTAWEGIVALEFDEASATLSQVAGSPFASPHSQNALALDPGGHYLYGVIGAQGGGTLEAWRTISIHTVNPLTGAVARVDTYDVGGSIMPGIAIAASDAPGPALTQIVVQPADVTVETTLFGITRTFTAIGTYSDGRSGPLPGASFTSSDPSIASIDPVTGVATLHAYGTTTITAQRSGVIGSSSFTVTAAPLVGLHVTPIAVTIAPGESRQLHATAIYSDNVTLDVTSSAIWTPLAPAVASVTAGLATGLAGGTTTINATFGGFTASAQLSVRTANVAAFVVDRQASRLRGYTRAAGSPALAGISGLPINVSSPEAVALDPRGRVLYVAETASDRILAFHVDGVTAELVPAPGSPMATLPQPSHVAIDPAGRFLYAIHRGDLRVSAFAIGANGALTPTTVDVPLPSTGRSLTVDASGRFLYIGLGQGDGNDTIRAYRIDGGSGALTLIGDYVTGRFPVDVQSDPAGRFLYVANSSDSHVSTYTIHPSSGALARVSTINTGFGPNRLSFHPSGGVLYVTAQSPSRVLSFLVNGVTGALTPVADVPLLGVVNNLAVEPSGAYLYIADERFAQYSIDTLGNITLSGAHDVGTTPVDVAIGVLAADTGAALTSLAVVPSSLLVYGNAPGQTRKISALGTYSTGAQAFLTSSVTWTSSDPTAVSISDDGTATVLTVPSTVTLTATLGAVSGTATFVASNAASRIAVMPASETATVGSIGTYRATAIYPDDTAEDVTHLTTWASLDPLVASVDGVGAATAIAYGDARITATVAGVSGNAILRVRGIDNHLFATRWSFANELAAFKVDSISGDVTANGAQPTEGAPWGVAADPSGRWVYVANRESASVSAFAVTSGTGTLTPIGTYPSGGPWPRVPVVEPRGRFLYVANYGVGGSPSIAGYADARARIAVRGAGRHHARDAPIR